MKPLIVVALVAVVAALGGAGFAMLRRGERPAGPDKRMARALALRVGLSIALFVAVLLAWKLGWIAPSGLPTGR